MAKQPPQLQRPAAQTPAPQPELKTAVTEPPSVALNCRTCFWRSPADRCHRYPPTVITPQKDAADFPLLRPGFWCGEHKQRA
jgi:hypothetical protein